MDADRFHVVLARDHEGELAVIHQRQLLTIGRPDGVERLAITGLLCALLPEGPRPRFRGYRRWDDRSSRPSEASELRSVMTFPHLS
jgi:hypothetical protein